MPEGVAEEPGVTGPQAMGASNRQVVMELVVSEPSEVTPLLAGSRPTM